MDSINLTIGDRPPRSINAPEEPRFMRRRLAGAYLQGRYGFGSPAWLAKLATVGGGPKFHKAGAAALYKKSDLDEWALGRIGRAQSSTSDVQEAA